MSNKPSSRWARRLKRRLEQLEPKMHPRRRRAVEGVQ